MTAAHLPGAILTPRCRGARAVAKFNAAERHGATNQIQRIPVGQLSGSANAAHGFCLAVGSAALFNAPVPAGGASVTYGCTKSRVGASDAGSIPATSTTTGVHGFDGALIRDGQPAMVPAASGSPLSRGPVRWAKSKLPTTTAITSRCFALRDAPAGRGVTKAGTFFNAADARSRADRDADNRISARPPSRDITHCPGRSSARPAALFNAVSNERSPEPGRCLVSSEAPGCRGDAYTQPSPCEMTTHCMAKANVGDGGRHGCTQHSDRKRRR